MPAARALGVFYRSAALRCDIRAALAVFKVGLGVFTGMLDTVRTKEFLLDIGGL